MRIDCVTEYFAFNPLLCYIVVLVIQSHQITIPSMTMSECILNDIPHHAVENSQYPLLIMFH